MAEQHATSRRGRYPPGLTNAGWLGIPLVLALRKDPLAVMTEMARQAGDIGYARVGPWQGYFVSHPHLVHEVLATKVKSFRKLPLQTRALSRIQGLGLVSSDGDFWLRQRRLVQPAFQLSRFPRYCGTVVELSRRWAQSLQIGSVFDIERAMTQLVVKIIGKVFFNVSLEAEEAARLATTIDVLGTIVKAEFGRPFLLPDWLPLPANFRRRNAIRIMNDFINRAISQRRDAHEDYHDLLSMLLLAVDEGDRPERMTDQQVRAEAATLFNAAHDSTGAGLTWTWYAIATHPVVERRLRDEIHTVLNGRPACYDDLPNLPYTTMVVRESLRLYPPVPIFFTRQVVEEVELGGYLLPRGANVFTGPWTLHRNPRFFDNPLQFDPDRFSPERIREIPEHAYLPFASGPHVCIGRAFAEIEMVLIIATILQSCSLRLAEPDRELVGDLRVSVRPRGGLPIRVCPVKMEQECGIEPE